MCLLVFSVMVAPRISRQSVILYLTVITLHFGSVAETPAHYRPHILFIYSIIMKKKELEGTALFKADKDDVSASNMAKAGKASIYPSISSIYVTFVFTYIYI